MSLLLNSLKLGMTEDMDVVRLPSKYRPRHILVMGQPGTGKSKLIETFWQQDSYYPYSKILIDPSGELAKDCLYLSRGKAIYCSLKTPVSLNLMNGDYDIHTISESLRNSLNQMITHTSEQNKELTVKMCAIFDRAVTRCLERGLKIPH